MLRRTFSVVSDLRLEQKGVIIEWDNGLQSPFSNWLLRDLDSLLPRKDFDPDLRAKSVTLRENSNSLLINWSDGEQSLLKADKLYRLTTGGHLALPKQQKWDGSTPRRVDWTSLELPAEVAAFLEELWTKGVVITKHSSLDDIMQRVFALYQPTKLLPRSPLRSLGSYLSTPPVFIGVVTKEIMLVDGLTLNASLPADTQEFMSKQAVGYSQGNYVAFHPPINFNKLVLDQESRAEHCYPAAFYRHWSLMAAAAKTSAQAVRLAEGEAILFDNSRFLHSVEAYEGAYAVAYDDSLARVRALLNPLRT
jgi:hypothetical protein